MDRSPCVSCDLGNGDKNNPTCMECNARVRYVSGLVGRAPCVAKAVQGKVEGGRLKAEGKGPCVAKAMQGMGENKMTILEDKVEEIIDEICAEEGVELPKLREGKHFKKYSQARKRIAERLVANYGMSKQKIGELTGVSNQAIYYLLKKNQASLPASGYASQLRPDKTQGKENTEAEVAEVPNREPATVNCEPERSDVVTIDFSGRAKILDQLEKYAKEEIRSVPDQILYFIQTSLSWVESEAERLQE